MSRNCFTALSNTTLLDKFDGFVESGISEVIVGNTILVDELGKLLNNLIDIEKSLGSTMDQGEIDKFNKTLQALSKKIRTADRILKIEAEIADLKRKAELVEEDQEDEGDGKFDFKQAVDPTGGKGVQNIPSSFASIFKVAFTEDANVLADIINKLLGYNLNAVGLNNGAFMGILLHYHPYLAEVPLLKKELEKRGYDVGDHRDIINNAIKKYESKEVNQDANFDAAVDVIHKKQGEVGLLLNGYSVNGSPELAKKIQDGIDLIQDLLASLADDYKHPAQVSTIKGYQDFNDALNAKLESLSGTFDTVGTSTLGLINGSPELIDSINAVIQSKETALREKAYEDMQAKLATEPDSTWRLTFGQEDVFQKNNEVSWTTDNGIVKSGVISDIVKSKTEGGLLLVKDLGTGGYSLVSTMVVTKKGWHPRELNDKQFNDWKSGPRKEEFIATMVTVKTDAFRDYAEEPRDKSKDVVSFKLALKALTTGKGVNESDKTFNTEEHKQTYYLGEALRNGTKLAKNLTEAEKELLINFLPISIIVTTPGQKMSGSTLNTNMLNITNEHWAIDYQVRKTLINMWILAGGEFQLEGNNKVGENRNNAFFKGIEASWAAQEPGVFNEKAGEKNKINDITDIGNIEIFAVKGNNKGYVSAYDMHGGTIDDIPPSLERPGLILLRIRRFDGSPGYLVLEDTKLKDFNNGAEQAIVEEILTDYMLSGKKPEDRISDSILANLRENSLQLLTAFGKTEITYGKLFNTIIMKSDESNQISMEYKPAQEILRIGDEVFNKEEFQLIKNTGSLKKIIGLQHLRTGFTGEGLLVSNKDYLNYLIENKGITTNVPKGERALSSVVKEKDGNRIGSRLFLRPDSFRITDVDNITRTKGKESTTTTTAKKVDSIISKGLTADGIEFLKTAGMTLTEPQMAKLPEGIVNSINEIAKKATNPAEVKALIKEIQQVKKTLKDCKG